MAKGSLVSALSRSLHPSLLPGHPVKISSSLLLLASQRWRGEGIVRVGEWGSLRVGGWGGMGVLLKGPERRADAVHSATLISRHTPPSMAKDWPGTVPGGNLDICVFALLSWADM